MSNDILLCFQPSFPDKLPPPLITRVSTFRLCPHFTFQLVPSSCFSTKMRHTWGRNFLKMEHEFLDIKVSRFIDIIHSSFWFWSKWFIRYAILKWVWVLSQLDFFRIKCFVLSLVWIRIRSDCGLNHQLDFFFPILRLNLGLSLVLVGIKFYN